MMIAEDLQHPLRRILIPLGIGAIALAALSRGPAQAQNDAKTYIIGANDGYGIAECLSGASTCGKQVANAWCEAHGHGAAIAYGLASDLTASIGHVSTKIDKSAVVITCGK